MRELSLHILDIVQNSIAAGASRIVVAVESSTGSNALKIRVSDDGRGMEPEFAAKVRDPFVTTRTVRRIGLGIPMLAAASESCGGGVAIDSRPGEGTSLQADFELNHIDRAPMGDIAGTMVTVIAANPEVAVRYEHRVDGRGFVLDTDEIKAQLEDVPISDPAVVRWIREYITEGISNVGGIT